MLGRLHNWSTFAVVREGIYFVPRAASPSDASLQFLRFSDRSTRVVVKIGMFVHNGLSVSPDGRFILFSVRPEFGADLMLVENFR